MKKLHRIQWKAFLLLLVYLFSIHPGIVFHHHKLDTATCKKSTDCKKSVFFSYKDGNCTHKTHVAKANEKCWLCDNHTISTHDVQTRVNKYFSYPISGSYLQISKKYCHQAPSNFANRGPPSV